MNSPAPTDRGALARLIAPHIPGAIAALWALAARGSSRTVRAEAARALADHGLKPNAGTTP